VVVIDLTQEMMASDVISQPTGVVAKLSAITKIRKYRKLHEGHHFIMMAMEVHDTPRCDMDRFIRECAHLFHNRQSEGHLSLSFCIQFFRQHIYFFSKCFNLYYKKAIIKRKIVLVGDVCFGPPITIRSHNLHVGNIKRTMGEIASYHKD
jgi:hypothetical protein